MRHRLKGRKLGRKGPHRKAMTRNLVRSLFTYGRVVTTLPRAKDIRVTAEKIVTLAKRGGLQNLRRIISFVGDRKVGEKIATDIAGRFRERKGGYTRIIRLGGSRFDGEGRGRYAWNRLGDDGERVFFELVDQKDPEEERMLAGRGILARQALEEKRREKKSAKKAKKK